LIAPANERYRVAIANGAKVTVQLDAEEVAKARVAMGAAESEPDAAIVQRVLNGYLLKTLLDEVNESSRLSEDDATQISVDEVRAYRREHRASKRGSSLTRTSSFRV
jgi:hypothetical protein